MRWVSKCIPKQTCIDACPRAVVVAKMRCSSPGVATDRTAGASAWLGQPAAGRTAALRPSPAGCLYCLPRGRLYPSSYIREFCSAELLTIRRQLVFTDRLRFTVCRTCSALFRRLQVAWFSVLGSAVKWMGVVQDSSSTVPYHRTSVGRDLCHSPMQHMQ